MDDSRGAGDARLSSDGISWKAHGETILRGSQATRGTVGPLCDQGAGLLMPPFGSHLRTLLKRRPASRRYRVGWVTRDPRLPSRGRFGRMAFMPRLRGGYLSDWIDKHCDWCSSELYDPKCRYDAVIFIKVMQPECQEELRRIQEYGGKVVFDANVNYYEISGDYSHQTPPTPEHQAQAIWMTQHADAVVADSSYIASLARKYNEQVTWIPDNINLQVFSKVRAHRAKPSLVLGWSGIPSKAHHLLDICPVLAKLKNAELCLITGQPGDPSVPPEVLRALRTAVPCRVVRFDERRLVQALIGCDVVISPKRLANSYDMGHTELKITVGMALGLPAVASPQQSYQEAISYKGGGIIVSSDAEWLDALKRLEDWTLRREMGERARQTVVEKYSVPVVATQFLGVIETLVAPDAMKRAR
jgi:glycosyltransferase involved in cell wall biosynthesis